jgi:heme-degrading monooxygenase HmoA
MSVTFINCFEVAPGADADFLARWQTVNAYMIRQPGYLAHALHRSLGDDAQYRPARHLSRLIPTTRPTCRV